MKFSKLAALAAIVISAAACKSFDIFITIEDEKSVYEKTSEGTERISFSIAKYSATTTVSAPEAPRPYKAEVNKTAGVGLKGHNLLSFFKNYDGSVSVEVDSLVLEGHDGTPLQLEAKYTVPVTFQKGDWDSLMNGQDVEMTIVSTEETMKITKEVTQAIVRAAVAKGMKDKKLGLNATDVKATDIVISGNKNALELTQAKTVVTLKVSL
jgi:hypothetical protein